jgi:hypothetical protein
MMQTIKSIPQISIGNMTKEQKPLSELALSVKPGKYRHFKGGEYEVLGVGTHTETDEEFVVYKSMSNGMLRIRPVEMFLEEVDKPEYNYKGKRFIFVGNSGSGNFT